MLAACILAGQILFDVPTDTQGRVVFIEERRDFDQIVSVSVSFNLEGTDDGIVVARFDGAVDGIHRISHVDHEVRPQQHDISWRWFPINGLLVYGFAAIFSRPCRCRGETHRGQEASGE